jgi:hypothetical protein
MLAGSPVVSPVPGVLRLTTREKRPLGPALGSISRADSCRCRRIMLYVWPSRGPVWPDRAVTEAAVAKASKVKVFMCAAGACRKRGDSLIQSKRVKKRMSESVEAEGAGRVGGQSGA